MAKSLIRRFGSKHEAELVLHGGILSSPFAAPVFLLSNKTLILSSPAAVTVTFTGQLTGPVTTPNGFDFVDGVGGNDSVDRNDGGDWEDEGYVVGDNFVVTNATTGANDGSYPILAVSTSSIEVATASFTADSDDNTATFSHHAGEVQTGVSIKSIIDQIVAQTTDIAPRVTRLPGGLFQLALVHTAATPSEITLGAGTANELLGFVDNQTGTFYNPPDGAAPRWLSISAGPLSDNAYTATMEE